MNTKKSVIVLYMKINFFEKCRYYLKPVIGTVHNDNEDFLYPSLL